MTRFVIDVDVALQLVRDDVAVPEAHALVAPALLKSQVLQHLHSMVRSEELSSSSAVGLLDRFATTLKVRYLSDRVSRKVAFDLAAELDDDSTALAEYLAVTRLQADAFVTLSPEIARQAADLVPVVGYDELTR